MARLKGGKILLKLGYVEDNENYVERLPKELKDLLREYIVNGQEVFKIEVLEFLKSFEISFTDEDGLHYKINPMIILADDLSTILLQQDYTEINGEHSLSVKLFTFLIYVDSGDIAFRYNYSNCTIQEE